MKIILQGDYYTTILNKTHNEIEEIIFKRQLKLRNNLLIAPLINGSNVCVIVVQPTHILVHPRVHRAHRLKRAALGARLAALRAHSVVSN